MKKRLKAFPYLRGNKLSNFYIRSMAEKDLFKVKDLNELDIPVDKNALLGGDYFSLDRKKKGK